MAFESKYVPGRSFNLRSSIFFYEKLILVFNLKVLLEFNSKKFQYAELFFCFQRSYEKEYTFVKKEKLLA